MDDEARRKKNSSMCFRVSKGEQLPGPQLIG
jgi:hypothetical protein